MKKRVSAFTFLMTAILFCLLASSVAAQSNDQFNVTKIRCFHESGAAPATGGWGSSSTCPNKWQLEYHMKNSSDKSVATIYWSFRFVNKEGKTVVEDFKTKRLVKPGKETTYNEAFEYNANLMPEAIQGAILIRRLEFDDGSAWQPKPDESDPALIKTP
jgi:hypothetical protein